MKKILTAFLTSCFIWVFFGCGSTNLYKSYDNENPAEEALVALENNQPDKAIKILEEALADEPTNYTLVSIMASAIAQKHGVEPLTFALAMATEQDSASGSNEVTSLFTALPEATNENVAGITSSVTTMNTIPSAHLIEADNLKLAMLLTAQMGIVAKKFDADFSGEFEAGELDGLTTEDATIILTALANAAIAMNSVGGGDDDNSTKAGAQITAIQTGIDSSTGATDEDKLKNYLESQ